MIFKRALRRELINTASGVFMTLFTITVTIMLVRILSHAARGRVDSGDVIALIGFAVLNYMAIIMVLTGFISVLLVITRSYHDSEMVVWFSSGMSLKQWIRPVLTFAIPVVLVTSAMSFFVTPWAAQQSAEFKERYEKRDDVSRVTPGKFQESPSSNRVFFVEGVTGDLTKMKNVFVNSYTDDGRLNVVVAKEGSIRTDKNGDKLVVLENGMHYESTPGQKDFQLMDFERYSIVVASKDQQILGASSTRATPTLDLLANLNRYSLGELLWRMGMPCMCLLLMLLAIPLSFVNPRAGRSANLIVALLLFITYSNLISFLRAAVARGNASFGLAWWPLHVAVGVLILGMFVLRMNVNSRYHPHVLWSLFRLRRNSSGESDA